MGIDTEKQSPDYYLEVIQSNMDLIIESETTKLSKQVEEFCENEENKSKPKTLKDIKKRSKKLILELKDWAQQEVKEAKRIVTNIISDVKQCSENIKDLREDLAENKENVSNPLAKCSSLITTAVVTASKVSNDTMEVIKYIENIKDEWATYASQKVADLLKEFGMAVEVVSESKGIKKLKSIFNVFLKLKK